MQSKYGSHHAPNDSIELTKKPSIVREMALTQLVSFRSSKALLRCLSTKTLPWRWPSPLSRPAVTSGGHTYTYGDLHEAAGTIHNALGDVRGRRVGVSLTPSFGFVATMAGIWLGGGGVVPVAGGGWKGVVRDAGCHTVVGSDGVEGEMVGDLNEMRGLVVEKNGELGSVSQNEVMEGDNMTARLENKKRMERDEDVAMLLYTSGTTGKPKGVVWTHDMIQYQVKVLSEAWKWCSQDRIVSALPLNHVHGLVNVVLCSLHNGAHVELMERFDVNAMWDRLDSGDITVFMGVPTMYRRLIKRHDERSKDLRGGVRDLRLSICGSAALDGETWERWEQISGKAILERYGMTEVGMALSNGYEENKRLKEKVGCPLKGVMVKVAAEDELRIKGPGVFKRYWRREEETRCAFDGDGWFKTGDVVTTDQDGNYAIVGRLSTDIIKSGGYKISALEIERMLSSHGEIDECAVVGIEDADLGQQVMAMAVPRNIDDKDCINESTLLAWIKERLPRYKVPRRVLFVPSLPKNNLGKIQKKIIHQALVGTDWELLAAAG